LEPRLYDEVCRQEYVESYDEQEQLIEGLFIDDLRINPVFGAILDL
jgi:hypothetical protein